MSSNLVKQSENKIDGDQAGRDINKTILNINNTYNTSLYLQGLYIKFLNEESNNPLLRSFIEDLDYYNSQVEDDEIIGLDKKLIQGNRKNVIWYAKDVKERYHKKLLKTCQFSEIAQKINVYLLATVRSYYMLEIYPNICNGEEEVYINTLITEKIIKPIITELGENLLSFTPDDVQGMLYFLTGNCHIKWSA